MSAEARELHHIASNHVSIGRGFLPAFSASCRCTFYDARCQCALTMQNKR